MDPQAQKIELIVGICFVQFQEIFLPANRK